MKNFFLLLITLWLTNAAFSQTETLVSWSFPSSDLSDTIPDEANLNNQLAFLSTMGGTGAIEMKNGFATKAAQCNGWDNGIDQKAWYIRINTAGYENLTISSKQQSGNTDAGPRNFKLQYRTQDMTEWMDVENGEILAANDWTTSELTNLPLPEACNDKDQVDIRWVITSNLDINGDELLPTGKTKIDDIMVVGDLLTAIPELNNKIDISISNPVRNQLSLTSNHEINKIEINDLSGRLALSRKVKGNNILIDINLKPGLYILGVFSEKTDIATTTKMVVQ